MLFPQRSRLRGFVRRFPRVRVVTNRPGYSHPLHRENSLNRHGRGGILGTRSTLPHAPALRDRSVPLRVTSSKHAFPAKVATSGLCSSFPTDARLSKRSSGELANANTIATLGKNV